MSRHEKRQYHEHRAQDELLRAAQSSNPVAARAHRQLAALHRRRVLEIVHFGEVQGTPRLWIGARQLQQDLS